MNLKTLHPWSEDVLSDGTTKRRWVKFNDYVVNSNTSGYGSSISLPRQAVVFISGRCETPGSTVVPFFVAND